MTSCKGRGLLPKLKNMDDVFTGLSSPDYNRMRVEADEEPSTPAIVETDGGVQHDPEPSHHETRDRSPTPPSSSHSSIDPPSNTKNSTTSTSSTSSITSATPSSLESFQSPKIDYCADNSDQKLVAVIGREFDEATKIAQDLQNLTLNQKLSNIPVTKYVPYTIARSTLKKCKFSWRQLSQYDLVCLCYNASEARILLTGIDGFYTTLLANLEGNMGTNKVAFVITKYSPPTGPSASSDHEQELVSPHLTKRLSTQEALKVYLDNRQVLSWSDKPCPTHTERLEELAMLEPNSTGHTCTLL